MKDIIRTLNIRFYRLHWEELTRRNLLKSCSMPDIINARHSVRYRPRISDVSNIEFHFIGVIRILRLQIMPHVILLLLIATENTDLADVSG